MIFCFIIINYLYNFGNDHDIVLFERARLSNRMQFVVHEANQ